MMNTAPSYFLPPFEGSWRIVNVDESPLHIRIDWLQEESLATDWEIALVSVTRLRTREGPPDADEALEAGLLPGITDGTATAQIHEETAQQTLFGCSWTGDFAKSDQTLAVRLVVDGRFLVGIACRMRPRMESGAAAALLESMRSAQRSYHTPEWERLDPDRDPRFAPQLQPYLRLLDEAMAHDDHVQAQEALAAMRPALALSPLSSFALRLHIAEGWAEMQPASAQAASSSRRSIEILRRTLDNFEPAAHPELYRTACTCLAEAYARRDQPGDLLRALAAYRSASRLDDAHANPARVARLHLRMGVLHHHLARETSAQQTERLQLALPELDRAEELYGVARDLAGLAEAAIAKADAVRLLGRASRSHDADELYGVAWNLLQQPAAADALGAERYDVMLEHVRTSMRVRGAHQLNVRAPSPEIAKPRATALFIRPASDTRLMTFHPPGDDETVSLEVALRRALKPDVALVAIGASQQRVEHESARGSRGGDQDQIRLMLQQSQIVVLVPGFSWGLQPELHRLIERGWLSKLLLIMLPASAGFSLQDGWEQMRSQAFDRGLNLPAYTSAGALLRPDRDGTVIQRVPFDTLWEPHRLLDWLADLLSPMPGTDDADEKVHFAELERQGLLRRLRERHPKPT